MDAGTTERVYTRLKMAVLTGAISMHRRVDFAEVAEHFGVSTTPVREAAMRLWGAGLLEPHEKGGLRAILASEERLRAQLTLNHTLLVAASASASTTANNLGDASANTAIEVRTRSLFRAIAKRTSNSGFIDAIEHLSDQLAIYRHREQDVFADIAEELECK